MNKSSALAAVTILIVGMQVAWGAAKTSSITDLGPGMEESTVSDKGDVALTAQTEKGERAILWRDGQRIELSVPAGYTGTVARDINDRGQVAGYSYGPYSCGMRATVWTDGAAVIVGKCLSAVYAINNRGQAVGYEWDESSQAYLVMLWERGESIPLVMPAVSQYNTATSINDHGQVVGVYSTATWSKAFIWENGRAEELQASPNLKCTPRDINNRGQVVGVCYEPSGHYSGFLWQAGVTTRLGDSSTLNVYARRINERGDIVGQVTAYVSYGWRTFAVIWRDGVMMNLETLVQSPDRLYYAYDINNHGQLTVLGRTNFPSGQVYVVDLR